MFSTKGQEVPQTAGLSKSLQPGVVLAHIFASRIINSDRTGKKALELTLEGPAIENFEGWSITKNDENGPKFKGQSARVTATVFTDQFNSNSLATNEILAKICVIADIAGVRSQVDAITGVNTIEEWVQAATKILSGIDLYWFLKGEEEEYNGKTLVKLSLPKYKFVSNSDTTLDKFDKTNVYHYKALATTKVQSFEPVNNDFDM